MQELDRRQQLILIGFVLLILAVPFMVLGVRYAQDIRSSAKEKATPQNVVFTNITSSSVTVTYKTEAAVTGSATATGASGVQNGTDSRDSGSPGTYLLHHVTIPNLKPATEYDVAIFSDGESFEAGKVKTLPLQETISTPDPLYGKVEVEGISEALVYAVAGNSDGNTVPVSEAINNSTFVLDKGALANPADGKKVDLEKVDIVLFVDALDKGKAKVQFAASEDPPAVTLVSGSAAENLKFDPNEKITVGSQPSNPDPDPDTDPDPDPDGGNKLDEFSESLLTGSYSSGAELINAYTPYNIFISNISPTGFTVNWLTKQPATGYIEVVESGGRNKVVDPRDGSIENAKKRYTHSVEAKSGSIPAGTTFEFYLVSNGISFGRNLEVTANDYNSQFKSYAAQYYPDKAATPAQTTQTTPGQLTSQATAKPAFTYQPSSSVSLESFKVIIPAAPDSAPLPVVQQGSLTLSQSKENAIATLATLAAKNPELANSMVDLNRDAIVAARTSDGTWSSAIVTETNGFSLSLGSTLTTNKDKYLEVSTGDNLNFQAFASLGQQYVGSQSYADSALSLSLEPGTTFVSILHGNSIREPLLVGYAKPSSSLNLVVNGVAETATVNADGSWQSRTQNLKSGLNELTITDPATNKSEVIAFIVAIEELPVTSLGWNQVIIVLGVLLLAIGIISYRKYNFHR